MEKILDVDTVLTFGKHKGKLITTLLTLEDVGYLKWLRHDTDWKFSNELQKAYRSYLEFLFTQQSSEGSRYGHDAGYGQAFDNCAGGLMY